VPKSFCALLPPCHIYLHKSSPEGISGVSDIGNFNSILCPSPNLQRLSSRFFSNQQGPSVNAKMKCAGNNQRNLSYCFLPVFRTMALDIGTSGTIVTANFGATTPDGCSRILLKRRGFQVAEMPGRQFCDAMAIRTCGFIAMLIMLTGEIVVILVRETIPCRSASMAGVTLSVYIDGTGRPGRRGLAAVTACTGAGTAVAVGRAAHSVEAGQNGDIGGAVMGCSIMARYATRGCRTEAQYGVVSMGALSVRRGGA
jgi:hypothetical protein